MKKSHITQRMIKVWAGRVLGYWFYGQRGVRGGGGGGVGRGRRDRPGIRYYTYTYTCVCVFVCVCLYVYVCVCACVEEKRLIVPQIMVSQEYLKSISRTTMCVTVLL